MSATNATRPVSDTELDEDPDAPPMEEEFWGRYNAHYEFPIGTAVSVLAHVLIVAVLVFGFLSLMNMGKDKKPVSVFSLGEDDSGQGIIHGGGENQEQLGGSQPAENRSDQPPEIQAVRDDIDKQFKMDDPTSNLDIPDVMVEAYKQLDKELRDKLLAGGKKGTGSGSLGGAEGTGADSTRARGLRWIMRFSTRSGQDYLNQLRALKAVVLIPVPPKNNTMIIIRDLGNPRLDQHATDADIAEQANKIQFQDVRKSSTEAIQEALRLGFTPAAMIAFFPKELEETMSRLEVAYQNKKPEDIKETIYQVIFTGGEPRLQVVAQKLK